MMRFVVLGMVLAFVMSIAGCIQADARGGDVSHAPQSRHDRRWNPDLANW